MGQTHQHGNALASGQLLSGLEAAVREALYQSNGNGLLDGVPGEIADVVLIGEGEFCGIQGQAPNLREIPNQNGYQLLPGDGRVGVKRCLRYAQHDLVGIGPVDGGRVETGLIHIGEGANRRGIGVGLFHPGQNGDQLATGHQHVGAEGDVIGTLDHAALSGFHGGVQEPALVHYIIEVVALEHTDHSLCTVCGHFVAAVLGK